MRSRYAATILVAALVGVGATGCSFVTPQATTSIKEAADGVEGEIGTSLAVRNATLISDDDTDASLLVTFANSDSAPATVAMQYTNASGTKVTETQYVEGNSSVSVGGNGDTKIVFTDLDIAAGSLFPVYFQYGTESGTSLLVPVLTSDWPQFDGLAPTPTPTPTITATITPRPGVTGTPVTPDSTSTDSTTGTVPPTATPTPTAG